MSLWFIAKWIELVFWYKVHRGQLCTSYYREIWIHPRKGRPLGVVLNLLCHFLAFYAMVNPLGSF